jgi:hypothetical protein
VEVAFDAITGVEYHVDVRIFAVLGFGAGAHLD